MYIYFNPNHKRTDTTDCVVRALCKITGQSWHDVYWDLCDIGAELMAWGDTMLIWGTYLNRLGFVREVIPNTCPHCYTDADFAADHPYGDYGVATEDHLVAVSRGNIYDSWDSSDAIPAYYYEKRR